LLHRASLSFPSLPAEYCGATRIARCRGKFPPPRCSRPYRGCRYGSMQSSLELQVVGSSCHDLHLGGDDFSQRIADHVVVELIKKRRRGVAGRRVIVPRPSPRRRRLQPEDRGPRRRRADQEEAPWSCRSSGHRATTFTSEETTSARGSRTTSSSS
jgi:hypothetical protein